MIPRSRSELTAATLENTMAITTISRRGKEPIIAADQDELVSQAQEHARGHGGAHGKHVPSPEHVLMHAQRDTPQGDQ